MAKDKAEIIKDEEIRDGLENLIANLGTSMDKRSSAKFVNKRRLSLVGNKEELEAIYETDWLAGKVVDIIPNDMTREWRSFTGDIDPETVELLVEEENRLELSTKFNDGHKWARLYGTAYIVMSVDDGQTSEKPLNIEAIKEGGLKHINVVDRHRVSTAEVTPVMDPMSKNFGMPEFYRFNETSVKIHHSRVIRFDGDRIPYDQFRRNNYNHNSVLDRLYESLLNLNIVSASAASMVHETNVDAIKVKNLMTYLTSPEGEELLRKRFALAGLLKSFNNMMLLDTEEEWDKKSNTFAGLPDLIDSYSQALAGASDIPVTRLLNMSPSGLTSTGEGDLKNYYDKIRSTQVKEYKPKLDYFDIIMAKSLGLGEEVDLRYEFNSLFQMTDKEQADLELAKAQRDQIYLDRDVVSVSIIAKELKQDGTYTNIDDEYIEELEELENEFASATETLGFEEEEEGSENEEGEGDQNSEESGDEVPEST